MTFLVILPTGPWWSQEGLLKQEVWSSRLQWLGVKAKIEIPLSGTGFNVRQNTLHIWQLAKLANGYWKCLEGTILQSEFHLSEHCGTSASGELYGWYFRGLWKHKSLLMDCSVQWILASRAPRLCRTMEGKHSFLVATQIVAQNHTTAAGGYPPVCSR